MYRYQFKVLIPLFIFTCWANYCKIVDKVLATDNESESNKLLGCTLFNYMTIYQNISTNIIYIIAYRVAEKYPPPHS